MKFRVIRPLLGLVNGQDWPAVGEELPEGLITDEQALAMASGEIPSLVVVAETAAKKAEKRPAKKAAETR